MKLLLLSISCLYLGTAHAVAGFILNPYRFATAGSSFLVQEGFEGTGYENTWTESATGTVDEDHTGTVIAGSQSLQINLSGQTGSAYVSFAGQSSLFCKFRFRVASTNGGTQPIATIRNGTTVLGTLALAGANRNLRATAVGGANGTAGDTIATTGPIYVWVEYVKGTGADAIFRCGWSDTDSKPTMTSTGTRTGYSTGSATTDATRLYLGNTNTGTVECFFDAVQVSATAF